MCNFFYVLETQHHYLVWLTRYHILDRNHCIENCSPFPKPQNNLTIFFYGKKKWKYWYFSLIFEVSKIRCRLITVWGSTTMCLDGGALSSCECRRVVSVLTVIHFLHKRHIRKLAPVVAPSKIFTIYKTFLVPYLFLNYQVLFSFWLLLIYSLNFLFFRF